MQVLRNRAVIPVLSWCLIRKCSLDFVAMGPLSAFHTANIIFYEMVSFTFRHLKKSLHLKLFQIYSKFTTAERTLTTALLVTFYCCDKAQCPKATY